MAKDRFLDRFRRKTDKEKLDGLADRKRAPGDIAAEEEMIKNTKKVEPIQSDGPVGRNAPCPCGSGKKYKKCCGAK